MKKYLTEDLLNELKTKWQLLQNTPTVFAYNLNVTQRKYLPAGQDREQKFYAELNPERTTLRRKPQTIITLDPQFDKEKFNFQKINPLELLMQIPHESVPVSLIINRSPLTPFHMLICPDVDAGYPQRITLTALCFSVDLLRHINSYDGGDSAFRIGYNSPGAMASVNHLHLHLIHLKPDVYMDNANLELLASTNIYRLSKKMPTEAICFLIDKMDTDDSVILKLKELYVYLNWLCEQNIPHNLYMTPQRQSQDGGASMDAIKIFIYAREKYYAAKDLTLGFCELSGYITVGDKELFNNLTQQQVIAMICEETGQVYQQIYKYFLKQ